MTLDQIDKDRDEVIDILLANTKRLERALARMIGLYVSQVDLSESGDILDQFAVLMSWALDGADDDPPPGGATWDEETA